MPISSTSLASRRQSNRASAIGCIELAQLFQDPLLEEPLTATAPTALRHRQALLVRQAENACLACPLIDECLYRAVIEHDVAGVAGGTIAAQRMQIRRRLGITVDPEDFDTLAGVVGRNRQVDHDEVIRLLNANPHESLETLAHRLGCSLSTVKRHLRRERNQPSARVVRPSKPTLDAVLAAAADVTHRSNGRSRAA